MEIQYESENNDRINENNMYNDTNFNIENKNYINILKFISKEVNCLTKEKHIEIFSIIHNNTNKYSENNNGIFINLTEIEPKIIKKIYEYIIYMKIQEKNIKKIEKEKEQYSAIFNK